MITLMIEGAITIAMAVVGIRLFRSERRRMKK